jgi:hypothetical protein
MRVGSPSRACRLSSEVFEVDIELFDEPEQSRHRQIALAVLIVGECGLGDAGEFGKRSLRHLTPDAPGLDAPSECALCGERVAGHTRARVGRASPTSDVAFALIVTTISRGHWPVSRNAR